MRLIDKIRSWFQGSTPTSEPEYGEALKSAFHAVVTRLERAEVPHAVIGGLALAPHGVVRATQDADFLVDAAGTDTLHNAMLELGFECLNVSDDVSNYLLAHQRVDILHAHRSLSQKMLRRAQSARIFGRDVPVATVEDVVALKLQARRNDPGRLQDTADIAALVRRHQDALDLDYLREFFKLFDCEDELDRLLADP